MKILTDVHIFSQWVGEPTHQLGCNSSTVDTQVGLGKWECFTTATCVTMRLNPYATLVPQKPAIFDGKYPLNHPFPNHPFSVFMLVCRECIHSDLNLFKFVKY